MPSHETYLFKADYTWNVFVETYLMENVLSENVTSLNIKITMVSEFTLQHLHPLQEHAAFRHCILHFLLLFLKIIFMFFFMLTVILLKFSLSSSVLPLLGSHPVEKSASWGQPEPVL